MTIQKTQHQISFKSSFLVCGSSLKVQLYALMQYLVSSSALLLASLIPDLFQKLFFGTWFIIQTTLHTLIQNYQSYILCSSALLPSQNQISFKSSFLEMVHHFDAILYILSSSPSTSWTTDDGNKTQNQISSDSDGSPLKVCFHSSDCRSVYWKVLSSTWLAWGRFKCKSCLNLTKDLYLQNLTLIS